MCYIIRYVCCLCFLCIVYVICALCIVVVFPRRIFCTSSILRDHINLHSNLLHHCTLCSSKCFSINSINNHVRIKHIQQLNDQTIQRHYDGDACTQYVHGQQTGTVPASVSQVPEPEPVHEADQYILESDLDTPGMELDDSQNQD